MGHAFHKASTRTPARLQVFLPLSFRVFSRNACFPPIAGSGRASQRHLAGKGRAGGEHGCSQPVWGPSGACRAGLERAVPARSRSALLSAGLLSLPSQNLSYCSVSIRNENGANNAPMFWVFAKSCLSKVRDCFLPCLMHCQRGGRQKTREET